eukprot:5720858-Alexandrium_andersonii.AAC.1
MVGWGKARQAGGTSQKCGKAARNCLTLPATRIGREVLGGTYTEYRSNRAPNRTDRTDRHHR